MAKVKNKRAFLDNTHDKQWRDPAAVIGLWESVDPQDTGLLTHRTRGDWWPILARLNIRLLVSREYEHLVLMLGSRARLPEISCLRLPHPSGIAVDRKKQLVYIAGTRNPNQVFVFRAARGFMARREKNFCLPRATGRENVLVPVRTNFYPGSLYIHDLALIGEDLFATATGHNMVVRLPADGGYVPAWWPRCVASGKSGRFDRNYIQLNSMAAGKTLHESFFSSTAQEVIDGSPRDSNFPVDQRGVIWNGKDSLPVCTGLTRPHSARLYKGKIWVDNSGYGELGYVDDEKFRPVVRLPGWTRGLCFYQGIAFVGTSRILPRFERFAPGLNPKHCVCGIHAVDVKRAKILASVVWPQGNQIFAVEWISRAFSSGFPQQYRPVTAEKEVAQVFYDYC